LLNATRSTARRHWTVCGAIAVFPLVSLALTACSRAQSAQAHGRDESAKPVRTEAVRQETVRRTVDVVGTLAAVDEATVSSEADGVVSRIFVDLGDRVHANEAMVELDREKLQYNVDQQQASLARALARYGASSPDRLPPIEQTPDVQKASAELVQARQSFDRAEELHKRELVPRQTLDDADALLRSKQASYDAALQNAKNLRADIDASQANLRLAARQLRDATIRAPFDGYVQKRLVNLGQLVKAPTPIMSLVRVDPLKVTAEIPERLAPWIKVGQPVKLSVDAYPGRTIDGQMSRISPAVDTQTRAFPFEALVPNRAAELKPGTFARVNIETAKIEQVLTLPYSALQYRYGVNRVFVVNGDRLVVRELKIGDRLGERVEIVAGVKAGELVAATDVEKLVDGLRVSVDRQAE
jgi:multidrug efflux pump subunit AcrA (membrane-fusion protein)